jgi:hypothetical protein
VGTRPVHSVGRPRHPRVLELELGGGGEQNLEELEPPL